MFWLTRQFSSLVVLAPLHIPLGLSMESVGLMRIFSKGTPNTFDATWATYRRGDVQWKYSNNLNSNCTLSYVV